MSTDVHPDPVSGIALQYRGRLPEPHVVILQPVAIPAEQITIYLILYQGGGRFFDDRLLVHADGLRLFSCFAGCAGTDILYVTLYLIRLYMLLMGLTVLSRICYLFTGSHITLVLQIILYIILLFVDNFSMTAFVIMSGSVSEEIALIGTYGGLLPCSSRFHGSCIKEKEISYDRTEKCKQRI